MRTKISCTSKVDLGGGYYTIGFSTSSSSGLDGDSVAQLVISGNRSAANSFTIGQQYYLYEFADGACIAMDRFEGDGLEPQASCGCGPLVSEYLRSWRQSVSEL
jgi:hypothetical protein